MPGLFPMAYSKDDFAFLSEKTGSNHTEKKCDQGLKG